MSEPEPNAPRLRPPPHSIEAEQSAIGAVLLKPDLWPDVAAIVSAADFYRSAHKAIFEAMREVAADGQRPDAVTVLEALKQSNMADRIGGSAFLAELIETTPGTGERPSLR